MSSAVAVMTAVKWANLAYTIDVTKYLSWVKSHIAAG
jgi:hypothetical protein